jgi:hypothetical protein
MKVERPEQPTGDAFARQLANLSAQLREGGVPPARDLWPDLDRALDRALEQGFATGSLPISRRRRLAAAGVWVSAALAATVLIAVGFGVAGRGTVPGVAQRGPLTAQPAPATALTPAPAPAPAPAPDNVATRQGLRAAEQALADLQTALKRSPGNPDLSRLVLMIHHSRGRLLRLQADGGVRNALRGRG